MRHSDVDVICTQETVRLDLVALAREVEGWTAWQEHAPEGKANTGILYRISVAVIDVGYDYLCDSKDTRRRYIPSIRLRDGRWIASAHMPPERDIRDWPAARKALAQFAHGKRVVICMDSNTHAHGLLESATGLTWHGAGMDGVLTNLPVASVEALPKLNSDHHPVRVVIN